VVTGAGASDPPLAPDGDPALAAKKTDSPTAPLSLAVQVPVRWAGVAVACVAVASLALVGASFSLPVGYFLLAFVPGLGAAVVASFAAPRLATEPPMLRLRRCVVDSRGICTADGVVLCARGDAFGVVVTSIPRGYVVDVRDRRLDTLRLTLATTGDVGRFLASMGLDQSSGIIHVRGAPLISPNESVVAVALVLASLFFTIWLWGPVVVPLSTLMLAISLVATPTSILVGNDGVHLRWVARRHVFPIDRIQGAVADGLGVRLATVDGKCILTMPHAAAVAFAARVQAALDAFRGAPPFLLEQRLARGERSVGAWIADLRRLDREASYRGTSISSNALVTIAGDVKQRPIDRVAAALAASVHPEARASLRQVARSTADDDLRRAFDQVVAKGSVEPPLLDKLERRSPPQLEGEPHLPM
jgi:hypothetical protein